MAEVILHDYYRSSASYRVRIALNLKRIAYTRHSVDLAAGDQQEPAWRTQNAQGFVPMLEIDGRRLTQSLAIADYLDAKVADPPFVTSDPGERSHILALALIVACDIHPLNNLRVLKYLSHPLDQSQDVRDAWYRHWVTDGLAALEALAAPRAGAWLAGDALSLADICLVPQLYNARRFDVPLGPYPTLVRAEATALAHSAFIAAHPDRQGSHQTSVLMGARQEQPA